MDVVDFVHSFKGSDGEDAVCHIRTVSEQQRPVVVVCSELPENQGPLITKVAPQLYREITEELHNRGILDEKEKICFWVEHIPESQDRNESLDLVTFLPWPDGRLETSRRPGDLQAVADITGYPADVFRPDISDQDEREVVAK